MSNIEILSRRIDGEISSVRTALGMGMYPVARNCLQGVGSLIDEYRAEVAKEIEGLKRDVKSAEGWRDEWKLDAAASDTKLDKAIEERDAALDQAHQLRKSLYEERGGKTAVQLETENAVLKQKVENLGGQVSFLKQWVQDLQAQQKVEVTSTLTQDYLDRLVSEAPQILGVDPGAPEGDKTVIVFECCGVTHFFIPPKFGNWHHESECHECGSKTSLGIS